MISDLEQRRNDLLRNLRHACNAFDLHNPKDVNGRADILHRVRHIESELTDLGGYSPSEFAEYCKREDAAEAERKEAAREKAYAKTGTVSQ
jgi:hypothetical protein